jgi:hypothetical protein
MTRTACPMCEPFDHGGEQLRWRVCRPHEDTLDKQPQGQAMTSLSALRALYGMWVAECGNAPNDAAFIAISRTALPALIDEVSRLRGEVERMRTVAVKLIECFDDGSLQVDHTDADTDPLRPVPVCGDDHDACSRETCPAVWVVNDAARIIEHRFNGPTAISTARKGEP